MILVIATVTRTIWWALIFLDSNHFLNKPSSVKRSSLFITSDEPSFPNCRFYILQPSQILPSGPPASWPWPAFWQLIETVHYSAYMCLYEFTVLSASPSDLLECLRVFIRIPAWKKALRKKKPWSKNQRLEPGLSQCTYIQIQWPNKHSHWIFHVLISHPLNPLRPSCAVKNIRKVAIVTC